MLSFVTNWPRVDRWCKLSLLYQDEAVALALSYKPFYTL